MKPKRCTLEEKGSILVDGKVEDARWVKASTTTKGKSESSLPSFQSIPAPNILRNSSVYNRKRSRWLSYTRKPESNLKLVVIAHLGRHPEVHLHRGFLPEARRMRNSRKAVGFQQQAQPIRSNPFLQLSSSSIIDPPFSRIAKLLTTFTSPTRIVRTHRNNLPIHN